MPLGTLDRTPPPFFKQGPSALSKLMLCSALALLLMVADARFKVAQPLRSAVAAVLYPIQWLVLQPVHLGRSAGSYLDALHSAQQREREALVRLADQGQRAAQVEQLTLENERLRQLLSLRASLKVQSQAAEVLYDAADPYVRRVIVDRGQLAGVAAGAPVLDEAGVLGQVTRVYPMVSEVTLVVDRDHAIPVMNARTGVRSVAFGDGGADGGGGWTSNSWPRMPMCKKVICWSPVAWTRFTRRDCLWHGSNWSSAGPIPRLCASTVCPWPEWGLLAM